VEKLFVEIYAQLNDLNENVLQPANRLKEIARTPERRSIEQQLALVKACLETIIRQLRALSEGDDASELADRQAMLATKWHDEVLALRSSFEAPERAAH